MAKERIVLIEPIGGMNFTPEAAKRGNQAPPYAIETLGGFLKESSIPVEFGKLAEIESGETGPEYEKK